MNLKEFAVNRKIEHGQDLLDYVVKNQDVPCEVLEASFAELLAPLQDVRATALLDDHVKMLREYVPVTYKQDPEHGYIVSGNVPDAVLEAITLVHGATPEEAITAMIEENATLLSNQNANVVDLSLYEHAQKTWAATKLPAVADVQAFVEPALQHFETQAAPSHEPTYEPIYEPTYEPTYESAYEPDIDVPSEQDVQDVHTLTQPDETFVEAFDDLGDLADTYEVADTPNEEVYEEDVHEEAIEDTSEEDDASFVREAMRRVYSAVIADIKSMGLDQELNLNL